MIDVIRHGDSRKLIKELPDEFVDIAILDPPYGINYQSSWWGTRKRFSKIQGDETIDTSWLPETYRVIKDGGAIYLFTRWDVMCQWMTDIKAAGFTMKNCIVWDKNDHGMGDLKGAYGPTHEFILFAHKGRHILKKRKWDLIRCSVVDRTTMVHPTQKPVGVINHLLDASTVPGDLVLDMFAGSGTVPVACKQSGRHFIAYEINEEYHRRAKKRIETTNPPLFVLQQGREEQQSFL